jgi:hypothetical protein
VCNYSLRRRWPSICCIDRFCSSACCDHQVVRVVFSAAPSKSLHFTFRLRPISMRCCQSLLMSSNRLEKIQRVRDLHKSLKVAPRPFSLIYQSNFLALTRNELMSSLHSEPCRQRAITAAPKTCIASVQN